MGYYLIGYRSGETLSLREEMALQSELSDAVGLEVDLRNLSEAPLELRGRVLEDGVRVYSGDDAGRVGLERDLLARYHEYSDVVDKPKLDQMLSNLRRYLAVLQNLAVVPDEPKQSGDLERVVGPRLWRRRPTAESAPQGRVI